MTRVDRNYIRLYQPPLPCEVDLAGLYPPPAAAFSPRLTMGARAWGLDLTDWTLPTTDSIHSDQQPPSNERHHATAVPLGQIRSLASFTLPGALTDREEDHTSALPQPRHHGGRHP